jgi:hypothetical protein
MYRSIVKIVSVKFKSWTLSYVLNGFYGDLWRTGEMKKKGQKNQRNQVV